MRDFLENMLAVAFMWTYFVFPVEVRADSSCVDITNVAFKNIGLLGSQFWQGKADDATECASMCLRRKPCNSINYDTSTKMCELNSGLKSNTPTKNGINLLYSEIKDWPKEIDPHCHHRPCADDEVCIPGSILASAKTDSSGCTYSCMSAGRAVCPMPSFGVSNGRTVGSVNVLTCDTGYVGGGEATCLPNKKCDNDIQQCQEKHGHQCSRTEPLCSQIYAKCISGKCSCDAGETYDRSVAECVTESTIPATTTVETTVPNQKKQWVQKVVQFSSEYTNTIWSAKQVVGSPDVYPRYGDLPKAWAPKVLDSNQFIEVQFAEAMYITGVEVYETFNAGGIKAIKAKSAGTWTTLWSVDTVQVIKSARIFAPQLLIMASPSKDLRIEVDCTVSRDWVEIDAVRLVGSKV